MCELQREQLSRRELVEQHVELAGEGLAVFEGRHGARKQRARSSAHGPEATISSAYGSDVGAAQELAGDALDRYVTPPSPRPPTKPRRSAFEVLGI